MGEKFRIRDRRTLDDLRDLTPHKLPLLIGKTTKLKAGAGIKAAKLGKLKRGSKFQVPYYGKRLYMYAEDSKAVDTTGEGLGGIWFAIKPSGTQA